MMDAPPFDIVIAGAGLSASLLALRLAGPGADGPVRIVMIDAKEQPLSGHTWSFHDADLTAAQRAWLDPAIRCEWSGQDVRFPSYLRDLKSGYASVDAGSLGATVAALADVTICRGRVGKIDPACVTLEGGQRITGRVAIDARGFTPHPAMDVRYQKFLGQELRLTIPHGLTRPVIMDATVSQTDGYRFVYLLPFDPHTVLVENTSYSDGPRLDADGQRSAIGEYVRNRNWSVDHVIREERGVLPIALRYDHAAFWRTNPPALPCIGLRALRFHPLTGYSLPQSVRSADLVAAHWRSGPEALAAVLRDAAIAEARDQGFYRLLSRMLFEAADPPQRRAVMERFYRLPEPLIERFYAGRSTLGDKVRVLSGRPPVAIGRALRCLPEMTAGT